LDESNQRFRSNLTGQSMVLNKAAFLCTVTQVLLLLVAAVLHLLCWSSGAAGMAAAGYAIAQAAWAGLG
jgi:hypothetical protein